MPHSPSKTKSSSPFHLVLCECLVSRSFCHTGRTLEERNSYGPTSTLLYASTYLVTRCVLGRSFGLSPRRRSIRSFTSPSVSTRSMVTGECCGSPEVTAPPLSETLTRCSTRHSIRSEPPSGQRSSHDQVRAARRILKVKPRSQTGDDLWLRLSSSD